MAWLRWPNAHAMAVGLRRRVDARQLTLLRSIYSGFSVALRRLLRNGG